MKLCIEILHTGNEDKFPEAKITYTSKRRVDEVVYHRAGHKLWRTPLGWPLGNQVLNAVEFIYAQAVKEEYGDE